MPTFACLLFTWMIAHADDFGRLPGSAAKVKALVIPMRDETTSDVEHALMLMEERRLIIRYTVDGVDYIQFPGWEKHQSGLHKRTKSIYPEPPGYSGNFPEFPGTSEKVREIPGQLNLTQPNLTKEREIAIQTIVRAYEETFGPIKGEPSQLMSLIDYMDKGMEVELIVSAIRKSSTADSPLKYAEKILANQLRKGIKTVEEAIQEAAPTKPKVSEHRPGRYISPDLPPEVKEQVAYELRIRSSGNGTVTSSNSH